MLVGCRRRGDQLSLQVWDTGPGIAADQQLRVFEEFYQVPHGPRTEAHQRKGLGLGLAIVKRLADLMGAPVELRSQPGRGTVFTLELPLGKWVLQAQPMLSGKGLLSLTLEGRTIVVVEDEPAVLSGLEALLHGWGASILAFDGVAACRAWVQSAHGSMPRPDLLIVDYWLEHGVTGADALALLRERFGEDLPAIVITGSTMSSLDLEAQQKNFHLLIKPVVPNKLRAMIAFKLGVKTG